MAEHFEFQELSDAAFSGVDLRRATFRDVDLLGARISHASLAQVSPERPNFELKRLENLARSIEDARAERVDLLVRLLGRRFGLSLVARAVSLTNSGVRKIAGPT